MSRIGTLEKIEHVSIVSGWLSVKEILFFPYWTQTIHLYFRNGKSWAEASDAPTTGTLTVITRIIQLLRLPGRGVEFMYNIFLCWIFSTVFFRVIYFHVLLKVIHFLQYLFLVYAWQYFGKTLKKFFNEWENRNDSLPCNFPVFVLKIMSVSKLDYLLLLLPPSLIVSLHSLYCPIRISISFYFYLHYTIKFISHHS